MCIYTHTLYTHTHTCITHTHTHTPPLHKLTHTAITHTHTRTHLHHTHTHRYHTHTHTYTLLSHTHTHTPPSHTHRHTHTPLHHTHSGPGTRALRTDTGGRDDTSLFLNRRDLAKSSSPRRGALETVGPGEVTSRAVPPPHSAPPSFTGVPSKLPHCIQGLPALPQRGPCAHSLPFTHPG